ncbi:MAG: lipoyl(octanoyl) transferase LipB [Proteobacteria bacterium]|nr:lipoyl(octanoyl) transferase LipB [Pseudomonadota bacterium]
MAADGVGRAGRSIEWRIAETAIAYPEAVAAMEARAEAIRAGTQPELVWLLEHPPLYTAGTSADPSELLDPGRFPVFQTGRGGRYTYHGPGQRVAYVLLDLKARKPDIRCYVHALEAWLIHALGRFGVGAERRAERIGLWVPRLDLNLPLREDKIAAIGVRVRRWVSFHGVALNVEPDLSHFAGIVPCGVAGHGVTSLVDLGIPATMADVDTELAQSFDAVFGAGGSFARASEPNSKGLALEKAS